MQQNKDVNNKEELNARRDTAVTDPNEKQLLEGLIESGYTDEEICAALGLSEEEYYNILNE
ncbi:hypothetical protein [Scopulibacillus daqui]|uniref:hypothetical protein n=1 Tax=Scopulibacillus daqui TaxID=1469162 RepID=UPI0019600276|nr:hypothetical protein [Scopulibacillus daqui]